MISASTAAAAADEDLHDLIAERYERASTIVTSNLDFGEWDQAFPNNRLLASATIDRLRHNAYCIELEGLSGRRPKSLRPPLNPSLPTPQNLPILKPSGMSVLPPKSGSITPIIPGSITPIGDNISVRHNIWHVWS